MIDSLYRRKPGPLHRYDSRLKLLVLPVLTIFCLIPRGALPMGSLLLFLGLISWVSLGFRDSFAPLRMIYPLLLLILLLTPLFARSGEPLWRLGERVLLTRRGVEEALIYMARFLSVTTLFFLLFRTTPMEDLLLALAWFRLPFTAGLVISVALRYIPHLAGLYGQIEAAHALRCSVDDPPPRKTLLRRAGRVFPILVSLMIQGVKTIPVLAMALELKGVGRETPRSRLRRLPPPQKPLRQILLTIGALVLLGASLLI